MSLTIGQQNAISTLLANSGANMDQALALGELLQTMITQLANGRRTIVLALGTVSATKAINIPLPALAGTTARVSITATTTVAANDTNYWTAGIVNKGAGEGTTVVADGSAAANSTKATGGAAITEFVQWDLTLSAVAGALAFSAKDVLVLTLTKAASGADLVDASVIVEFEPALVVGG